MTITPHLPLTFPAALESTYPLSSLTAYYSQLVAQKEDSIGAFFTANPDAGWAKNWPQGNSNSEKLVLAWLQAQQDNGATLVKTSDPLSDDQNALANPHHSLAMQIKSGRAIAL